VDLYQQYQVQSSQIEEFPPAANVSSHMCKFCLGFPSSIRNYNVVLTFCKSSSLTALHHGLPATGATIKNWILSSYDVAHLSVIQQFSESTFPVHFTCDLWSTPNHRAFLGLIGHWIDKVGNLKVSLLGVKHFKGLHTGLN
jgi:hypothetical protein